jgi:hypothetical protein
VVIEKRLAKPVDFFYLVYWVLSRTDTENRTIVSFLKKLSPVLIKGRKKSDSIVLWYRANLYY